LNAAADESRAHDGALSAFSPEQRAELEKPIAPAPALDRWDGTFLNCCGLDVKTEARSLLEWLNGWGDGPNWSDASGATVPVVKASLRRVLEYVLQEDGGRPTCSVCGETATCGVGQMDPGDHNMATVVSFCDAHRPLPEESSA
jgi:hypothetical protein